MKKIFLILSTVLAIAAAVSSCKDADETEIIATTGVTLNSTAVSIFPGEQVELKATLTPENGTSSYKTWASSDAKVATVDVWGRVLGLTPGEATITVTTASGKHTATCKVTVKAIPSTGVTLNKAETSVYIGESETFTATVTPDNASDKTITWTSSKPEIATVGEDGKVTGVELGTATITATTKSGVSASCVVTVKLRDTTAEQVTLWKSDNAGYRGPLGAASDNGKTAGTGNWLSYNDGVAYWTENTTGAPRKATLTLSTGSTITVNQVEAKDLAGNYTFHSYSFKATGVSDTKIVDNAKRQHETTVEFKVVENPKTVNGHVHNLDLVGLYLDFALPVSFEIVDDKPVIYTYLSQDYQKVSNGTEMACITQLTNSVTYNAHNFAPLKFGVEDCNYAWIGWGVDDLFGAPKFGIGTGAQRLVSEGLYCCGFSFVVKGYKESAYTTIYQFNYNNKWVYDGANGSAYFSKK